MRIEPVEIPGATAELRRQLEAAAAIIRGGSRFLVGAHEGPDGDAIGATLGLVTLLGEMGKEAVAYNRDGVPYNFSFLPGADGVVTSPSSLRGDFDVVLVVDCSSLKRVDERLSFDHCRTKVVCIDHHETLDENECDLLVRDVTASSVGEMLYRLMFLLQTSLSTPVAECLYVSIHTDTGGFRYQNTTFGALMVAAQLVTAGVDVWKVSSEVYENHPSGRVRLLGEVLETLHISPCGRMAFLTVSQQMYQRTGTGPEMLDGFINFARGVSGVEVAGQLRELAPDRYRVSFRSRGRVDVARLAERFGGGGHRNAAGCTIQGDPATIIAMLTREFGRILDAPG